MAETIQCQDCGAVLLDEDLFCGECGAPRPSTSGEPASVPKELLPATGVEAPSSSDSPLAPAAKRNDARQRWRVGAIVLLVLGVLACVAGLGAFVLFGVTPSEATTPAEDWLYGGVCCLLPIGGFGTVLVLAAAGMWYSKIRNR